MANPAEDDIITLVTSDDPPVELTVERTQLLDSCVFSDMLSLPKTGDCKARVDVAETARELETWLKFLRSGKVEGPDPDEEWQFDPGDVIGSDIVTIAKLVDKYACTSSRLLLIDELWRLLVEQSTYSIFIVLASEHVKADHVQRHAAAETLARRARIGIDLEAMLIDSSGKFKQWEARSSEWQALLVPARNRLTFERSRWYNDNKNCPDCQPGADDLWRELILAAGHDQNPIDSFARTLRSYPASPEASARYTGTSSMTLCTRWIKRSDIPLRTYSKGRERG